MTMVIERRSFHEATICSPEGVHKYGGEDYTIYIEQSNQSVHVHRHRGGYETTTNSDGTRNTRWITKEEKVQSFYGSTVVVKIRW